MEQTTQPTWPDPWEGPGERVTVRAYPEEWFHLHGKALSGLRHSHALRPDEDPDKPAHYHNGQRSPIGESVVAIYPPLGEDGESWRLEP